MYPVHIYIYILFLLSETIEIELYTHTHTHKDRQTQHTVERYIEYRCNYGCVGVIYIYTMAYYTELIVVSTTGNQDFLLFTPYKK